MSKREITKLEKQIVNDIVSRSNYNQEKATEIVRPMIDFGYTIHEQDFYKLKKVIEILKDKNVDIYKLLNSKSFVEYNKFCWYIDGFGGDELTEEEYDLLKEVLVNE